MAIDEKLVGKLFYNVPPYDDNNIYLGLKNEDPELVLSTNNSEYIRPIYYDEKIFRFRESDNEGVFFEVTLNYQEGITIYYADPRKKNYRNITVARDFKNAMVEIITKLRENGKTEFAIEVGFLELALEDRIWKDKTIKCSFVEQPTFKVGDFVVDDTLSVPLKIKELDSGNGQFECVQADGYNEQDFFYTVPEKTKLFEKQPKFKVGDRVLYPTTQNGTALGSGAKKLIEKAKNEKLGYLVVTDVTYNRYLDYKFNYWLGFQDLPNASLSFIEEECKLYEPTPEPKFKIGDRIKLPKTKEGVKLIAGMSNVWDNAVYIGQDYLVINKISGDTLELDNEYGKYGDYFSQNLDNIELYEISEPETPSKECEADASEILVGQVKNFYELNKTRIDKLDSKFSCKIIQALISLSIYESCGSPSSSSLPKAKTDLLSQISNLKI